MNDWAFSDKMVGDTFDKHVEGQLPFYGMLTDAVAFITRNYAPQDGVVYDIGASTGNISRAISSIQKSRNLKIISIESSADMVKTWKGEGEIICGDATKINYEPFDVAILFLTLMFIPVSQRAGLISELKKKKKVGGCIIIVDKIFPANDYMGMILRRLTFNWKNNSGVPAEQVISKELSLSGIQRPVTENDIGYEHTEFFRMGEFCGWVIQ